MSPKISPRRTARSMPRTASSAPYRFVNARVAMATSTSVIGRAGGADTAARPPTLGRAPAKAWRASDLTRDDSSVRLASRPLRAVDENLAVGRHAGLREADGAVHTQLHAHHLLDTI